jgi:hypothetical protein
LYIVSKRVVGLLFVDRFDWLKVSAGLFERGYNLGAINDGKYLLIT